MLCVCILELSICTWDSPLLCPLACATRQTSWKTCIINESNCEQSSFGFCEIKQRNTTANITTSMLVIKPLTLQYGVEDTPQCCLPSPTDQTCYHQDNYESLQSGLTSYKKKTWTFATDTIVNWQLFFELEPVNVYTKFVVIYTPI